MTGRNTAPDPVFVEIFIVGKISVGTCFTTSTPAILPSSLRISFKLSSTITSLDSLTKEKISKMLEESKNELSQDNLSDKARYILSHKLDSLSRINQ